MNNLISRQDAIDAMYRLEAEDIERYGCSIPEGFDSKPAIEALKALPSAEPEQKWIPFTMRELTTEEKEEHPEWDYIMDCELPDDGEEILVSDGKFIWSDTFINDGDGCYLDSNTDLDGCAWMPLPEPWRGE